MTCDMGYYTCSAGDQAEVRQVLNLDQVSTQLVSTQSTQLDTSLPKRDMSQLLPWASGVSGE